MKNFLSEFEEYCKTPGVASNKPAAYAKALEYLCDYLQIQEIDVKAVDKIKSIEGDVCDKNSTFYKELQVFLAKQKRTSYLEGGFVRAALRLFFEFIAKKDSNMKEKFRKWFAEQPQKDNSYKKYSDITIDAAIRLLESGMSKLGIVKHSKLNCFDVRKYSEFKVVYNECYSYAEAFDNKQRNRDFRNGLDFYLEFLKELNNSGTTAKIKKIIEAYKDDFMRINEEERYKWEAIGTYKRVWNIDAPNFAPMLKSAYRDSANLLRSGNYYPLKMLQLFAEKEPETVRNLFRTLFDEEQPFEVRCKKFQEGFSQYYNPQKLNHYQDLHAVSVYLTFEYPEKYYIYKYTVVKEFIKQIGYECESIDSMTDAEKMALVFELFDTVLAVVEEDETLKEISMERLDEKCYADEEFHLLTHDVIYFGSKFNEPEIEYYPSLEEYNPNISVEMWTEILNDASLTPIEILDILAKMLELGGESTCYNMAKVYGKPHNYYNMMGSNYGKRIKHRYGLPDCYDNGVIRYFPIVFLGRYVNEDGKNHYSWKLRDELKEALEGMDLTEKLEDANKNSLDKNIILYGPPGTGKTYNTAIYAVSIIENKSLEEVLAEDYADIMTRYNTYKEEGKVEFTTFHQSYGYEEFIEGIRPVMNEDSEESKEVKYDIVPGVFKAFCDRISVPVIKGAGEIETNAYPTVWKVSLWGTGDNPIRSECLDKNHIRIAYDEYGEDVTEAIENKERGYSVLNRFINEMEIGDIVISCYSASTTDAIGVICGEPEWHPEYKEAKRVRKVKWLVKDIDENIVKINGGNKFSNPTIHGVSITVNDAMDIVKKYSPDTIETEAKGNYVFIIDEINRGNISKILGELITLIEPTKRLGQKEEMQVKLPYSKKEFGVPDNVYIIGTMNTADRSIAAIDTALRRRFSFKEMMPKSDLLDGVEVEGISISKMIEKINRRIEVLYDREHTIGHAYFLPLQKDSSIEKLADIFKNKVVPLLQEYFYEDYEKIRLVLGDNQKKDGEAAFITRTEINETELFGEDTDVVEDAVKYAINENAFGNISAYTKMI